METRRIGSLEVSAIGLGCNNFGNRIDAAASAAVVGKALDLGVTFFDTADSYGRSEQYLGEALGKRRDDVVIATKFGSPLGKDRPGGASPSYVRSAVERSLQKLGTDRIDLYQLHRPDPSTPIADTLGALAELVEEGKVREIGCSNFTLEQLEEAESVGSRVRFVSVQNELNLLHRDDEAAVLPECARAGIAYLPYFPLASGMLTGKYRRDEAPPEGTRLAAWGPAFAGDVRSDRNFAVVERLAAWAGERGHTIGELAIAWLLAKEPVASVIAGATSPEQVEANVAAGAWRLSAEEVAEVDGIASSA